MAAGVGRAGVRIGVRVFVHNQGVQLADDGDAGAGAAPAGNTALNTGQGQPLPVADAQLVELVGHQPGGLVLAEPWFRVVQNLLGDPDDFRLVAVNGGTSLLLQLFLRQHNHSASKVRSLASERINFRYSGRVISGRCSATTLPPRAAPSASRSTTVAAIALAAVITANW